MSGVLSLLLSRREQFGVELFGVNAPIEETGSNEPEGLGVAPTRKVCHGDQPVLYCHTTRVLEGVAPVTDFP